MYKHKFEIGESVVCVHDEDMVPGPVLKKGQTYKVQAQVYHQGMDHVFLEGQEEWRLLASRFEKDSTNERLPTPIRVDFGSINIPSIIGGPCSTYNSPRFPSNIGGTWDINIPSVIVLDQVNIPSVIYYSGTGD